MKAIFNYNGKELVDEKIEDISLAIEFFDEELDDIFEEYDCMVDYVFDLLEEKTNVCNMFRIGLEAPIDEIVYFHFDYFTGEGEDGYYPKTKEELQILIKIYNEVLKAFNKDQVKIEVTSNDLWEDCNQQCFSLEEFLNMFRLEKEEKMRKYKDAWEFIRISRKGLENFDSERHFDKCEKMLNELDSQEVEQICSEWRSYTRNLIDNEKEFNKLWDIVQLGDDGFYMDFANWIIAQGKDLYDEYMKRGHIAIKEYISKNNIKYDDYTYECYLYMFN